MVFSIITLFFALSNPFLIDLPSTKDESYEHLENVQKIMQTKDVKKFVDQLYPQPTLLGVKLNTKEDFYCRCMRGFRQTLIDRKKGWYPKKELIKINGGGGDCIVLSCPIHPKYESLLLSLVEALREIGFKGSVFYRIGGYPVPTGEEVRFVAVPYSFKIFTMLEAYQMGYKNILWLDSAVYPMKSLDPLFQKIENEGVLISWKKFRKNGLLPETQKVLKELTGYEPGFFSHVSMQVFGLRMDLPWVGHFIEDYYEMCRLGTPFISCYPEEHVISALMHKYRQYIPEPYSKIILASTNDNRFLMDAKQQGYHFFLRRH